MLFDVPADNYDRFMGRYSRHLAPRFLDFAGVTPGQRVLDVGAGPGALTTELVGRLGAESVVAIDPSESFVDAARSRHPGVEVALGPAEDLPFEDDGFDAALAQLVVHFMADPVRGLAEMRRVTRAGGVVAACVWDGATGPVSPFWRVAKSLDPDAAEESRLAGARQGHLGELFADAGLTTIEETGLRVELEHATFDDWWAPYEGGVGPAGVYVAQLDPQRRRALRVACREAFGPGPFTVTAVAWAARGLA
jgi:SAM-dependent methyltransferase